MAYASTITNPATASMNARKKQPLTSVTTVAATKLLQFKEHLNSTTVHPHLMAICSEMEDFPALMYMTASLIHPVWDMETLATTVLTHPYPAIVAVMDKEGASCVWYKVENIWQNTRSWRKVSMANNLHRRRLNKEEKSSINTRTSPALSILKHHWKTSNL